MAGSRPPSSLEDRAAVHSSEGGDKVVAFPPCCPSSYWPRGLGLRPRHSSGAVSPQYPDCPWEQRVQSGGLPFCCTFLPMFVTTYPFDGSALVTIVAFVTGASSAAAADNGHLAAVVGVVLLVLEARGGVVFSIFWANG